MKNQPIISIVPALPPSLNGLGDFGWILANELKKRFGLNTVFFNTEASNLTINKTFPVESLNNRNVTDFTRLLQKYSPEFILVHYVGYAYSTLGVPYWLVKALQKHKNENPLCRIVTVFHELYSSGLPWTKAFWTKPFQKDIVFRLLSLSDHGVCNTEITYTILQKKSPVNKVLFLPVFSNVGEPSIIPAFNERENRAVIFGSLPLRNRLYKNISQLNYWLRNFQIDHIVDIGPGIPEVGKEIFSSIDYKSVLSADAISEILQNSKFGFIHYPNHLVSKSGVFAAYAAHGLAPIVLSDTLNKTSIKKNKKYFLSSKDTSDPEIISKNCFSWYQEHSVEKTSQVIADLCIKKTFSSSIAL